jgi:anti-sigma regulatory factor (Ser/Thr protein kinase)
VNPTLQEPTVGSEGGFHHEAFFYAGEKQFVAGAASFLGQALAAGEAALVVVNARKIDLLRQRLGPEAGPVRFADMDEVGTNPARIIPAWADFLQENAGGRLWGIGEPMWAERSPAEVVECQRHESLLNVAFAGQTDFTLMCPYDTATLGSEVIGEARRSHPVLRREAECWSSPEYPGTEALGGDFCPTLADPDGPMVEAVFEAGTLGALRSLVRRQAMEAGLGTQRAADAVAAANEVASNSLRYGGGRGTVRLWASGPTLICEIGDAGHIEEPMVGRRRPGRQRLGGRGLWMVNQLCALVQVRSSAAGTTVRMHIGGPTT